MVQSIINGVPSVHLVAILFVIFYFPYIFNDLDILTAGKRFLWFVIFISTTSHLILPISSVFPSLHLEFGVPPFFVLRVGVSLIGTCLGITTVINGANHTRSFAKAAATIEAHYACLDVSKALAVTGVRVLTDDTFFEEVWFHSW